MDHPAFQKEPLSEREAWLWMIENTVWGDMGVAVSINGSPVQLMRGQLSYSIRYLAKAWLWTPSKTLRFTDKLKRWDMIRISSETGQIIITICNYDKYQASRNRTEAQTETGAEQDRNRSGTNNNTDQRKNKKDIYTLSVEDVSKWLAQKRSEGLYKNIDEYALLEKYKSWHMTAKKPHKDCIAGFRGAFSWDNPPKRKATGQTYEEALREAME